MMDHFLRVEIQRWCFDFEPKSAKSDQPALFPDLVGLRLRAIGQVILAGRGNEPVHAEVRFVPIQRIDTLEADIEGKATFIAHNQYTPEFLSVSIAIPESMWRRLWDKVPVVKAASVSFSVYETEAIIPSERTLPISDVQVSLAS
jgi:hypothetical protein